MTIEERRARKAAQMRTWRARNPEKNAASWKRYYRKNRAKLFGKQKGYRARNPEKVKLWRRTDYERHSESYKARAHKRWREKNEECRSYYAKRYRGNKPIILARNRDYTRRNREKVLAWRRSYFKTPRWRAVRLASDRRCVKRATAYKIAWARIRRRTDKSYAIGGNLRARVGQALRAYPVTQSASVTAWIRELLGCSISELVTYLESKFLPGMSWENYGRKGWHIDHKRSCAKFDLADPEQRKQCFHYTNLQPLWAADNYRKGAKE
jgi:hypothetical protein